MNVTLRQLTLFESVARHLSFTRAAEEQHLTQPAVSIQIKQLEDNVGLRLFEQIGKRIYLTDTGRDLYAVCKEMLDSLARFEMNVADRKGLKQGRLCLAATTTAKYFLPHVLGHFCERYPGIDMSLKVTNQAGLLERLAANQDDLYVMGQPPSDLPVQVRPFMDNPLVMVAYPDHPLAGQSQISPQRFAAEYFLMREPGSGTRRATEHFFADHGVTIRERMALGSNEAIKQAVMAKLGIAVLSQSTVMLESEVGRVTLLDVAGFPIRRQWYIVYMADKKLSVVAQAFCNFLDEEGAKLAAGGAAAVAVGGDQRGIASIS